jgi:LacI family transcriptional regulator
LKTRQITIYDIATAAKVGVGTVSRVLNGSTKVSSDTRAKVLETARELNYQPHSYARWLTRRHARTIAVMVPHFGHYFYLEILSAVQQKTEELNIDLVLCGGKAPDQVEANILRAIQNGYTDGLILFSINLSERHIKILKDSGLPVVLADAESSQFDSFTIANSDGAYVATNHLIELGYTSIGMINAQLTTLPAIQRREGYKRALEKHGIPFSEDLIKTSATDKMGGFYREAGYQAMLEFLNLGKAMPKAFFVSSDIQAVGAIDALAENNFKVPEDIAIVGFDDIELAREMKLTTMRQPIFELGTLAVERIAFRMSNNKTEIIHKNFSPSLVIRRSCGALNKSVR